VRSTIVPALVEKGLSSTRASTKTKAIEGLLLCLELEQPDVAIEEIMSTGFVAKQPKVVAASINLVAEAVKYRPFTPPRCRLNCTAQ